MQHPLAIFHFCPVCGSEAFAVHNARSKRCSHCGFTYYHNAAASTVALIENGSWAPTAAKSMKALLESYKNLTFAENEVQIKSALNKESLAQLEALATELCKDY